MPVPCQVPAVPPEPPIFLAPRALAHVLRFASARCLCQLAATSTQFTAEPRAGGVAGGAGEAAAMLVEDEEEEGSTILHTAVASALVARHGARRADAAAATAVAASDSAAARAAAAAGPAAEAASAPAGVVVCCRFGSCAALRELFVRDEAAAWRGRLSVGPTHAVLVTRAGAALTCGSGRALGHGHAGAGIGTARRTPARIRSLAAAAGTSGASASSGVRVARAAAGGESGGGGASFMLLLDEGGGVAFSAGGTARSASVGGGSNSALAHSAVPAPYLPMGDGYCGRGCPTPQPLPSFPPTSSPPFHWERPAVSGPKVLVREVAAGMWHAVFGAADGSAWSCGTNGSARTTPPTPDDSGRLGHGAPAGSSEARPRRIESLAKAGVAVARVAAAGWHSAFVGDDGRLYTCGFGEAMRLGHPDVKNRAVPTQVGAMRATPAGLLAEGEVVVGVALGHWHTAALTSRGAVWGFGNNSFGQLGGGATAGDDASSLTPLALPAGAAPIVAMASGAFHMVLLDAQGAVYTYGKSDVGQLGRDHKSTTNHVPTRLRLPQPPQCPVVFVSIAACEGSNMALAADGRVWAWGSNKKHQLGLGDEDNQGPEALPAFLAVKPGGGEGKPFGNLNLRSTCEFL